MSSMLLEAAQMVFQPMNMVMAIIGVVLGTILGGIPGLTATMGIALLLPITYYMEPVTAIILLTAMFKGGLYGGSITAILFATPGTPAAAFTAIDGHEMTKKGQAGKALKVALLSSVTGDIFGNLVLIFSAGLLATVALSFGPPEYAALVVFSFLAIITLLRGTMAKGLIATALGVTFGMIGFDPVAAQPRFSFGSNHLAGGLELIPVLIGLLAVSEVLGHIERLSKRKSIKHTKADVPLKAQNLSFREFWALKGVLLRASAIGSAVGTLPGLGPTLAAFLGYQNAKAVGKNKRLVGTGIPEGVAGPEAANSAVGSANLVPLLSLGIPGDAEAAMILSVMILHGITPGPLLFENNGAIVYGIMFGILMAGLFSLMINWFLTPYVAKLANINYQFVMPVVLVMAVAGSYGLNQSMFDVYVMSAFAMIGYLMQKAGFSTIAMLIGFILGPMLEKAVRTSLVISGGTFEIFISRPISGAILAISFLIVVFSVLSRTARKKAK